MKRRTILAGATAMIGFGGCLSSQNENTPQAESPSPTESPSCEIACFEFTHEAWDDAPDWLTIKHTEGRDLPAEDVFITNVVVEYSGNLETESEQVIETVAWHEVDDEVVPSDGIAGERVRVDIDPQRVVNVLWRTKNEEHVLDGISSYGYD
ncbi:hypothetical protein [Halovenus salina]|uniref:hypothetical protein n=1 Tax=Halovenus salina TaxID=1510225 RepID=UPI002260A15B|nr:hypothetical protein [Halovenus salina]